MKLSELVAYRNQLRQFDIKTMCHHVEHELAKITHEVELKSLELDNVKQNLNQDLHKIFDSIGSFENTLKQHLTVIQTEIEQKEKIYFAESYRLYDEEMRHETVDWILNRRMPMSDDTQQMLVARVKSYCDWHYPAMIIRPGMESFIKHMVGFDPLYIIDQNHDLLTPCMQEFPIDYQRRLRPIAVKEHDNEQILSMVPAEQFGFCLAFNF